ncbi:hypothetical protein ACWJJH_05065 [Endozoicomonadaceae bacterium StTr2]
MILPRAQYVLATLVLLVSFEAIASLTRITSLPHIMMDGNTRQNLFRGAVTFSLENYSVTGVAGCCAGSTRIETRNIIITANQLVIFECIGEHGTEVLSQLYGIFSSSESLTSCMSKMRVVFQEHPEWQKHYVSVASVTFEASSLLKVYVDGFSTVALSRQNPAPELKDIKRYGGWCENVQMRKGEPFSYTNFLHSDKKNKTDQNEQKRLIEAIEFSGEFCGYLSYDNATSPEPNSEGATTTELTSEDVTSAECTYMVTVPTRLYIYTQGVALHPYEIVTANWGKSLEDSLHEVSDTFLERSGKLTSSPADRDSASVVERFGFAALMGVQDLRLSGVLRVMSRAKTFMSLSAPETIKQIQSGWLIPQNNKVGQACIIVDINVPTTSN